MRRCILAGTSEKGNCPECGSPWERETSVEYVKSPVHGAGSVVGRHYETGANNFDDAGMPRLNKQTSTTGWRPTCKCWGYLRTWEDEDGFRCSEYVYEREPAAPVPPTVLDPFLGSGTTALVARKHGRHALGIELSPEYVEMAAKRLAQLSLLAVTGTE